MLSSMFNELSMASILILIFLVVISFFYWEERVRAERELQKKLKELEDK